MKGLEPSTFCMARGFTGFCGLLCGTTTLGSKQVFSMSRATAVLRRDSLLCASAVGWVWDGIWASEWALRSDSAPWCICVFVGHGVCGGARC